MIISIATFMVKSRDLSPRLMHRVNLFFRSNGSWKVLASPSSLSLLIAFSERLNEGLYKYQVLNPEPVNILPDMAMLT